ncbi:hypothetical protein ACQPZU_15105 [Saccharomonospora azurea]
MKKIAATIGFLAGLYLIFRAAMEPFDIDMSDPATYRNDWGGPSLFGVLLVHMGPGAVCLVLFVVLAVRRRKRAGATIEPRPRRDDDQAR